MFRGLLNTKDDWVETQMLRKNFNLNEIIDDKFLKAIESEFEGASIKVFNVDVGLVDKDDSIIDIFSLSHKFPSWADKDQIIVDSNNEPFFISKIKKVIDFFQEN